jgi:uncharacterized membrane protein SpoIIM required for sporulation
VILDIDRFLENERPAWEELSRVVEKWERNPMASAEIGEVERFHYLYQRAASALARLQSSSGDVEARQYLESLVARAYAEIHQRRGSVGKFNFFRWLLGGFPQAFRRRSAAFALSLAVTIAGTLFGAIGLIAVPDARPTLMPFANLIEKPSARVAREESRQKTSDPTSGHKTSFAAQLMTHNIQVAVLTFAMGATWGLGVVTLLFYNGVTLGAVVCDYVRDGQAQFVMAWLMPHGVIEIPAILVGGQAGFVLAGALIGWKSRESRRRRLEAARADLASLAGGLAVMLVWAGIMEAFISQYHQPALPYSLKIAMGCVELVVLAAWLMRGGMSSSRENT